MLEELNLDKYQTDKAQELVLDLREDRFVKTKEAAFRDRNRSTFLHRLLTLESPSARSSGPGRTRRPGRRSGSSAGRRTARSSCRELDAGRHGRDGGGGSAVASGWGHARRSTRPRRIVKDAVVCELADALEDARRRLQAMAVESFGFVNLARAVESWPR